MKHIVLHVMYKLGCAESERYMLTCRLFEDTLLESRGKVTEYMQPLKILRFLIRAVEMLRLGKQTLVRVLVRTWNAVACVID